MTSLWPVSFSNWAAISFKGAAMPLPAITCTSAACALPVRDAENPKQSRPAIVRTMFFICNLRSRSSSAATRSLRWLDYPRKRIVVHASLCLRSFAVRDALLGDCRQGAAEVRQCRKCEWAERPDRLRLGRNEGTQRSCGFLLQSLSDI